LWLGSIGTNHNVSFGTEKSLVLLFIKTRGRNERKNSASGQKVQITTSDNSDLGDIALFLFDVVSFAEKMGKLIDA